MHCEKCIWSALLCMLTHSMALKTEATELTPASHDNYYIEEAAQLVKLGTSPVCTMWKWSGDTRIFDLLFFRPLLFRTFQAVF